LIFTFLGSVPSLPSLDLCGSILALWNAEYMKVVMYKITHVQVKFELKAVVAITISCCLCHHMWEIILSTFYLPFSNVV